jgi:hydroxymethylpyrimidine pyrophosphatase-like HAD family hydrolase
MRYHAMITDYDGTLTSDEHLSQTTLSALKKVKASGRKLIMATGRKLEEIKAILPEYRLFDCIVAENGALIYHTDSMEVQLIGEQPPAAFIHYLQGKGVPLSLGEVIVAGWEPHQAEILEAIKQFGLEHQVIFNKGAVMILPPGVNKASGIQQALKTLNLSPHNAVAIGDAENDCAMFMAVECAIAVQNAVPHVRDLADWTTSLPAGQGVCDLIDRLIEDDLASLDDLLSRHFLSLGEKTDGGCFEISPFRTNLLIAGPSGCGKTTLCAAFLEKMTARQYQYCLIDPEGDYNDISDALMLGDNNQAPSIEQVVHLLARPEENAVLCIVAIPIDERPGYFRKLIKELITLRNRTGHPHFIILDEAHHLIPKQSSSTFYDVPGEFSNFLAITTSPDMIDNDVLRRINIVMVMGELPVEKLSYVVSGIAEQQPISSDVFLKSGQVMVWRKENNQTFVLQSYIPRKLLTRHKKKYATGDMGSHSFYFKGPASRLNLKANNLMMFIQMATGIDDETWQYHRFKHDYSTWFRNAIKDADLAAISERIEVSDASASESRNEIFGLILDRYTSAG